MGDQLRIVVTLPIRETTHLANEGEPIAIVVARILNEHDGLKKVCDGSIKAEVVPDVPKERPTRERSR